MKRPDSVHASRFLASPNWGLRKAGVDCVILHYTGMADGASALARLCDAAAEVSCHYLVEENGEIIQLVAEQHRAWHAGISAWEGRTDINSRSVGIEIVNVGHDGGSPDFPAAQIGSVVDLCRDIAARHSILPRRFLAHSDIAPLRKQDPGEKFPWAHLHQHGIGHWAAPYPRHSGPQLQQGHSGDAVASLQSALSGYGYDVPATGAYDMATEGAVKAFQRHFRPARVDGIADVSTIATLRDLTAALKPV